MIDANETGFNSKHFNLEMSPKSNQGRSNRDFIRKIDSEPKAYERKCSEDFCKTGSSLLNKERATKKQLRNPVQSTFKPKEEVTEFLIIDESDNSLDVFVFDQQ